ncbi:MAG: hypothetical protein CMK06_07940 [Ponticaulis sp.]|nr:hypothetical protein [Ponticaulis sp.]MAT35060.1 hypothetical protein [Ponticaulis sp.]|tara:strand:- start:2911 stop:3141 length:231 start_codon:yes stop_codon:yes gene_type:complete
MSIELFYGLGAVILFAVLAIAAARFKLKSPKAKAISAEASREMYEEPERYDTSRKKELEARAERAEKSAERRENYA